MALKRDVIGLEHMLHQFPAVYVDLDIERESCLERDEYAPEFLIQIKYPVKSLSGMPIEYR
jgi:hypothetical protein